VPAGSNAEGQFARSATLLSCSRQRLQIEWSTRKDGLIFSDARDLLVNKLCALLSRSELRIGVLIAPGVSLDEAIISAPRKDGGFSLSRLPGPPKTSMSDRWLMRAASRMLR
jgi:hypothetical protein